MQPSNAVEIVLESRLVAIVRLDDLTRAEPLVRALLAGGIRAIELTLTNPDAPRVVRTLLDQIAAFQTGQATVGIGSVRTIAEMRTAIECGAQFLVSPIANEAIIRGASESSVPCLPGAMTPTEIHQAWEWGAPIVKLFPARALGTSYVKDLLAPMPYLKLMPTGGVDLSNLQQYLNAGAAAVGIGGQLFDTRCLATEDWPSITNAARQFVEAANQRPNE